MKMNRIYQCIALNTLLLLSTGCMEKLNNSTDLEEKEFFNFKTEQSLCLSIDYCFPNKDYIVLFDIYDQYPMEENTEGILVKKAIEPIYRAATDGSGKFSTKILAQNTLSKVWLYTEYIGAATLVELEVKNNTIQFNQNDYLKQSAGRGSKAVTPNQHTYPDGWLTLGDWNMYGTPDYLLPERILPSPRTLYNINEVLVKYNSKSLKERYPHFFEGDYSANINVVKPTKISLVFINTGAAWNSSVGYYVYPTGQEPKTPDEIKRIVVYPSVTPFAKATNNGTLYGALSGGDQVQLKYWDGEQFHDEFPPGVSIGWWLEGMGFNGGNVEIRDKGKYSRFSIDALNDDNRRRMVALRDTKDGRIVAIGVEDNIDLRYNDATFYMQVDDAGAIEGSVPDLPDVANPPSDEENYTTTYGTLLFEDLWPATGDYDMNDVMVQYRSKVYKHILNNSVYKIVDEITPYHSGGSLQSGFGYQLTGLSNSSIHKVTVEGGDGQTSKFMDGQMLESGQTYPTIVLFDNIRTVINKPFTVKIELNDVNESSIVAPHNPFIIVEPDKGRGKEVHLVKYTPTDKADKSLLGTNKDKSDPAKGLYYVATKEGVEYPFALNMFMIDNFPINKEGAKIDQVYPGFREWVNSGGLNNKDWYLHPAEQSE